MSWLDPLLAIKTQQAGTTAGTRQTINFASGATVTDDPANDRVNVAITDTGITQLTGDVTAGPGSGSIAATVAKVNGVSVSGTPTSGQVIRATSGTASAWANVARGDITNTSGATGDLITGNATTLTRLGIGSTGQVLTVSGGAPVWGGESRPPLDANHIHAWYLDEISGGNFTRAAGAVDLPTAAGIEVRYGAGIYARTKAAVYTSTSGSALCSATGISISPTTDITLEAIFRITPGTTTSSGSGLFGIQDSGYTTTYSALRFFTTYIDALRYNSGANQVSVNIGGGSADVNMAMPHHAMITWVAGGNFKLFLDGLDRGTLATSTRTNTLATATLQFFPGLSYADFRVSNVARDAAYATAATLALRGM